jgi:hypothetical protein
MKKKATLLLITILAFSSLIMIETVFAQSISKPAVPEFTLEFIPSTYNVTTTDPYTGVNTTEQFDNNTINIIIKNPVGYSFSNMNYYLFYNVKVKGHFSEVWDALYSYSNHSKSSEYSPNWLAVDENSEYTTASYPANYEPYSQLDFQVEAVTMYDGQVKVASHLFDFTGHYEAGYVLGETSDWSDTQTITIPASQTPTSSTEPTPTPVSPTPTPYNEPPLTDQPVILGVAVTVAVIGVGLGLLLYLIKRK